MNTKRRKTPPSWFRMYAARIFSFPKLTAKEEKHLFRKWEAFGDRHARDTIITSNLRYVIILALKYRSRQIALEDLIAEGNLGILVALIKYDSKRELRFYTYASYWIKARMLTFIIHKAHQCQTSAWPFRSSIFFKLKKEQARCFTLYGECDEAYIELAAKLQAPVDRVREAVEIIESTDISMDVPMKGVMDTTEKDQVPDWRPTPEDETSDHEQQRFLSGLVMEAMEMLDSRERYIMERRFLDDCGASLTEVGSNLGISSERVRQLEYRAVMKIRSSLAESGVRSLSMI